MKTYFVVTGVVYFKNKILILKKADDDYNYPKKWSFCSGYVKEFEACEETVIREIMEETRLSAEIVKKGRLITVTDNKHKKTWAIMVFKCKVSSDKVKLDKENTQYRWIDPKDLKNFDTVPGLKKDLSVLL